jgi:RNA polymerase sigma-70 factor (ECF subfamily)
VRAWESTDIDGFVALLRQDAVLRMPPWRQWYHGREAIRMFFDWAWRVPREIRIMPIAANRQPAFVHYIRDPLDSTSFIAHGIDVITLQDDAVAVVTVFRDPTLIAAFGLPSSVPGV